MSLNAAFECSNRPRGVKQRAVWWSIVLISPLLWSCTHATDAGLTMAEESEWPGEWQTLDSIIGSAVAEGHIPGAVLLIARDGQTGVYRAYGTSDPMTGAPMEKDALFRICSQTKAITATAAMILWERGQLDLDAPVAQYLPSFEGIGILDTLRPDTTFITRPSAGPLTIRHLMTHTAGIPYGEIGDPRFEQIYAHRDIVDLFPRDGRTTRDNADRLGATCLAHEPGTQWTYGLGLDILVAVIEVASGEPYNRFLQREILDPLEMVDTHFVVPEAKADRLVAVSEPDPSSAGWKPHDHRVYSTDYPLHAEWPLCGGGAGLTSTALDYARFLQLYLDRGNSPGGRILQEATVDSIMADQAPGLVQGWHQGLAFGVRGTPEVPGAFFWSGYFNTTGFGDPANGTSVVLMKQTYGARTDQTGAAVNALMAP